MLYVEIICVDCENQTEASARYKTVHETLNMCKGKCVCVCVFTKYYL
jgi:hypothetical protein